MQASVKYAPFRAVLLSFICSWLYFSADDLSNSSSQTNAAMGIAVNTWRHEGPTHNDVLVSHSRPTCVVLIGVRHEYAKSPCPYTVNVPSPDRVSSCKEPWEVH